MKTSGGALRLTILIGECDTWRHRNLCHELVRRAKEAGLAGASAFRGIEGFGTSQWIHTARILSLTEDLPMAIVIVDAEEKIRSFLPELDGLVREGSVIVERCELIRYTDSGRQVASLAR